MTKPLSTPGQAVEATPWPSNLVQMLESDFGRLQALWLRLDVTLATEPAPGSAAATETTDWLSAFSHDLAAALLRSTLDHLVTWHRIYAGGFRPTYAHLSLIRTAHESAWLAYWLTEPGVGGAVRLARGVAAQCSDYDERRKFEEAIGLKSASPPAKLAAERLADIVAEATSRGLTRADKNGRPILMTPLLSVVELFDKYETTGKGHGSSLYRLYSGYVHGKQWAVTQNVETASPFSATGRTLALVRTNPEVAVMGTRRVINATEKALDAFVGLRS